MSKTHFLKDNIALVAGGSLPVLLILLFWIATVIPRMTVADPQHDMLYTADYYDYNALSSGAINIEVREGMLRAVFRETEGQNYRSAPRIYYFDVSAGSTQELSIEVPADVADGQELDIPEAYGMTLSKKSIAPDGYSFDGSYSSRSGFFFFDGGYRYRGLIRKDGRSIKLPTHGHQYQGNLRFLGWVLEKPQS
jgi:hypothetical protein